MKFWFFFFQSEDGIRDKLVTGVQTCALPIYRAQGLTDPAQGGPAGLVVDRWLQVGPLRRHLGVEPQLRRRPRQLAGQPRFTERGLLVGDLDELLGPRFLFETVGDGREPARSHRWRERSDA